MEEIKHVVHPNGSVLIRRGIIDCSAPANWRFGDVMGSEYAKASIYWVEYRREDSKTSNIGFAFQSAIEPDPKMFRVGSLYQYHRDGGVVWHLAGETRLTPIDHGNSVLQTILEAIENACAESRPMWMIRRNDIVSTTGDAPFFLRDWVIANSHVSRLIAPVKYTFSTKPEVGEHPALTEVGMLSYMLREQRLKEFFLIDGNWLLNSAKPEDKQLIAAICYAHSEYVKTGHVGSLDKLLEEFVDRSLIWMR